MFLSNRPSPRSCVAGRGSRRALAPSPPCRLWRRGPGRGGAFVPPSHRGGCELRRISLTYTNSFVDWRHLDWSPMKKPRLPKPTDAELSILRVLWQRGPCTVRQVFEELNQGQSTGYTTVLKLMQIMVEKGLLKRDDTERSHVFEATLAEEETQRQLVGHLLERAFAGSAH